MTYEDVKPYCEQYGYQCDDKWGEVHITTKFEKWFFVETDNPKAKVRLMHKDKDSRRDTYHTQFTRTIEPKDLVRYINEHETSKYVKFVKFHMTKDGKKR